MQCRVITKGKRVVTKKPPQRVNQTPFQAWIVEGSLPLACSDYYFILKVLCYCQNHQRNVIIYRITLKLPLLIIFQGKPVKLTLVCWYPESCGYIVFNERIVLFIFTEVLYRQSIYMYKRRSPD